LDNQTVLIQIAFNEDDHDEVEEEEGHFVRVTNVIEDLIEDDLPNLGVETTNQLVEQKVGELEILLVMGFIGFLIIYFELEHQVW